MSDKEILVLLIDSYAKKLSSIVSLKLCSKLIFNNLHYLKSGR